MKKLTLAILVLTWGSLAFAAPLPYDSNAVKEAMDSNQDQTKTINKALAANDFVAVGNAFIQLAQNAQKVGRFAPPKGDPAEWARLWDDFLSVAFQGVGAAGAKDAVKAKAALDGLLKDMKQGHPQFRG